MVVDLSTSRQKMILLRLACGAWRNSPCFVRQGSIIARRATGRATVDEAESEFVLPTHATSSMREVIQQYRSRKRGKPILSQLEKVSEFEVRLRFVFLRIASRKTI